MKRFLRGVKAFVCRLFARLASPLVWFTLAVLGWLAVGVVVAVFLVAPLVVVWGLSLLLAFLGGLHWRDRRALDVEAAHVRKDTAVETAMQVAFGAERTENVLRAVVAEPIEPPPWQSDGANTKPLVGVTCFLCPRPANQVDPIGTPWCDPCAENTTHQNAGAKP